MTIKANQDNGDKIRDKKKLQCNINREATKASVLELGKR